MFLDTEFTSSRCGRPPTLLSVGLCTMSDDEFYGEVLLERPMRRPNAFVRAHVVPQLGRLPIHPRPVDELATSVIEWVEGLRAPLVDICYDHHVDFDLFEKLLGSAAVRTSVKLRATHLGYLNEDGDCEAAARECFAALDRQRGLKQHHALADSFALRARFVAAHGSHAQCGGHT